MYLGHSGVLQATWGQSLKSLVYITTHVPGLLFNHSMKNAEGIVLDLKNRKNGSAWNSHFPHFCLLEYLSSFKAQLSSHLLCKAFPETFSC